MMSAETQQSRFKLVGLIVGLLTLGLLHFHLQADTRPIVLAGQTAPGTSNGRFTSFGPASVNASGDMVFYAGLDVGGVQSAGVFKIVGGVLSPVVLEGQLLPDNSGRFFGGALSEARINNSGDIVFVANFTGASPYFGIFVSSGDLLRKVVDQITPIPGAPGQVFDRFNSVWINDSGDIAFQASIFSNSTSSGVFLLSHGNLQTVLLNSVGPPIAFNNNGDIVFTTFDGGVSLYSSGTVTRVASPGQAVSNSKLVIQSPRRPWINDAKDVVFENYQSGCCNGRGGSILVPNAIIRWRSGVLEKVVAAGDPLPGSSGFPGSVFDTQFAEPQINQSAIVFSGATLAATGQPSVRLVGTLENGQLNVVASENQIVEGLGTLSSLAAPEANFDNRTGPVVTFLSTVASASALFAAAPGRYSLLFPQIANGRNTGGEWRTTFILANRSTTAATALLSFYDDNGASMNVIVGGQIQNQISVGIPALGVAQIQTDGTGSLAAGWAMAQADQNLSGIALFGFSDSAGKLVNEVGAAATVPLRSLSLFVQAGPSTSTAVALANPNGVPSNLTLILRDSNSTELARTSLTLPANGHVAKYVGELFPSAISGEFEGKLELISTQPLIALTLRQREFVFTSLPVIP